MEDGSSAPSDASKLQVEVGSPTQIQQEAFIDRYPSANMSSPANSMLPKVDSDATEGNVLQIDIIEAKGLSLKRKTTTTGMAYVKLQLGSYSSRTRSEKLVAGAHVNWDQRVHIPFSSSNITLPDLHLNIYEQERVFKDNLGQVTIPGESLSSMRAAAGLAESPSHRSQWYNVTNKHGHHGGSLGQVRIGLNWVSHSSAKVRRRSRLLSKIGIRTKRTAENISVRDSFDGGTSDEEEVNANEDDAIEPSSSEDEEDRELAEQLERDDLLAAARSRKIEPGDWRIVFHVIEVRELNPQDVQGTSDPVCQIKVSCPGQKAIKRSTVIKKAVRSCVFDETFFFDLKQVDKDSLEASEVRLAVFDADSFSRNDLIGAYTFDVLSVYYAKDRTLRGTWVALVDDQNPADKGLQGYARVSITVLGPGDVMSEDSTVDGGEALDSSSPHSEGDMSNVLMPPNIKQELYFLRLQVYIATDLPNLDRGVLSQGGIDAYLRAEFNGSRLKTRVVTCKAKRTEKTLKAVFNEELLFPVFLQNGHALVKSIKIAVKDHDRVGSDDLVSTLNLNFQDVLKKTLRFPKMMVPPRWYPLYGAPVYTDSNVVMGMDSGACQEMNTHPSVGSAYRGSILLGMRCTKHKEAMQESPHKGMIRSISRVQLPRMRRFVLRFWALHGSEMSRPRKLVSANRLSKLPLVAWMTIGPHKIQSKAQPCVKGVVNWCEAMEPLVLHLPAELAERWESAIVQDRVNEYYRLKRELFALETQVPPSMLHSKDALTEETIAQLNEGPLLSLINTEKQIGRLRLEILTLLESSQVPDVFLYVGPKGKRISAYARFSAGSLLLEQMEGAARWIPLKEEKATNLLNDDEFPGSILARVGFAPETEAQGKEHLWDPALLHDVSKTSLYDVHVYLYKGSDIAAADSNGLSDPYCIVNLQGDTLKSKRKDNTCDPEFYQVLSFDRVALPSPDYSPYVTINLFDYDRFDRDDRLGSIRVHLARSSAQVNEFQETVPGPMTYDHGEVPKWYPVTFDGDADGLKCGSLLVGIRVLSRSSNSEPHPVPTDIRPPGIDAHVELLVLGLRQMQGYKGLPIQFPLVEVHMGEAVASKVRKTKRSKKPDGSNANFGERLLVPFKMPNDPVFMPKLHIRVVDHRFGGLMEPVVATTAIDLVNKMPNIDQLAGSHSQSFRPRIASIEGHPGRRESVPNSNMMSEPHETDLDIVMKTSSPFVDDATLDSQNGDVQSVSDILGFDEKTVLSGDFESDGYEEDDPIAIDEDIVASKIAAERQRMSSGDSLLNDSRGKQISISSPVHMNQPNRFSRNTTKGYTKVVSLQSPLENEAANPFRAAQNEDEYGAESESDESMEGFQELVEDFKPWPKHDPFPLPDYMDGREIVNAELESKLGVPPFETYRLYRGQKLGRASLFGRKRKSNYRKVGSIKCVVNILIPGEVKSPISNEFLAKLMLPRPVAVRINVLKGFNFQPLDVGGGKSDPYLKLKLGKQKVNDRKRYIENAVNPEFFRRFDMQTILPGASQLHIKAFDYDTFTSDDFIGETLIDLEDRWFSDMWRQYAGQEEDVAKEQPLSLSAEQPELYRRKPVELRSLWTPTSVCEQGQVEVWVDIMDQLSSIKYPPVDVSPPENLEYELRVVVWKTEDIPSFDDLTGQNDLFVKVLFDDQSKSTDTHWRCKKGNGSFNYRLKFKVKLPMPRLQSRLTIQVWDKDVLKWNDCIAESIVDLDKHMKAAFVQQPERHQVYDDNRMRESRQRRKLNASSAKSAAPSPVVHHTASYPQPGREEGRGEIEMVVLDNTMNPSVSNGEQGATKIEAGYAAAQSNNISSPSVVGTSPMSLQPAERDNTLASVDSVSPTKASSSPQKTKTAQGIHNKSSTQGENVSKKKKKTKKKVEDTEGKDAVSDLVQTYIPWAADLVSGGRPPNSKAIHLFKSGKSMGKVHISVELVRKDVCESKFDNGTGRSEPNVFPTLPKPTGRLKLSKFWNPFYVLEECLGPELCRRFVVGCCCIIMVPVLIFVVPNVAPVIQMVESLPPPFGDVVLGVITSLIILSCCYCLLYHKFKEEMGRCCKSCCQTKDADDILEGYEPMQPGV